MRPSASVSPEPTSSLAAARARPGPRRPGGRARCRARGSRRSRVDSTPRASRPARRCSRAISCLVGAGRAARRERPRRRRRSAGRRGGARRGRARRRVGGAAELEPVGAPDREVGALAGLERADVVAADRARAASCCELQAPRGALIAPGPPRPRATSSACFTSKKRSLRSFDAEPSTPSPTSTPASRSSRTGAMPAPSRRFEVGQCATPTPWAPKRSISACERWMQCAHQTSLVEPADALEVLDRACSRRARGSRPPPRPSRRGGCGGRARAGGRARPTPPSAASSPRRASRARRRSAPIAPSASPARRSVSASTSSICSTRLSGGRPPSETPRSIEPREATIRTPSSRRGPELGLDQARDAAREDVVVVEDGRAARERELGEAGPRRGVEHLVVDPRPDGIERAQPGEEVGVLRPGAREGLVEVVVGVDEAGRDDGAAEVSRPARAGRRRRAPRSRPSSIRSQPRSCSVPASSIVSDGRVGIGNRGRGSWHVEPYSSTRGVLTPRSLAEALELKAEHPDALPIQGGTDVMVALNFDRARPEAVLNLNEVRGAARLVARGRRAAARRRADLRRGDARRAARRCCRRWPRRRARSARRRSATAARSAATSAPPRRPATRCRRCSSRAPRSSASRCAGRAGVAARRVRDRA